MIHQVELDLKSSFKQNMVEAEAAKLLSLHGDDPAILLAQAL